MPRKSGSLVLGRSRRLREAFASVLRLRRDARYSNLKDIRRSTHTSRRTKHNLKVQVDYRRLATTACRAMHLVISSVEFLPDTHQSRRKCITYMHTGHRFAGERAWHHADQDQSILQSIHRAAHGGCVASESRDVGRHCSRLGSNLKNPSTTVGAE